MKKVALSALFAALVLSMTVGMAACKKDCTDHVDEDTDLACDVCGETVTKEEETTEAPCVDHVDADIDEACDKCGEFVEYVPTEIGFEGLYNGAYVPEIEEDAVYGQAELVSSLQNMECYAREGGLLFFQNYNAIAGQTKLAIVNSKTGNIVLTLTKEEDGAASIAEADVISTYDDYDQAAEYFIRVMTTTTSENGGTTYSAKLYTALGAEITEKKATYSFDLTYEYGDLYTIDGKVYEIKDGVATYKRDKGLGSLVDPDYSTDKNHYVVESDEVFVYDPDYKMIAHYAVPAGASAVSLYPLADGNVFVQYKKALPQDATEYDLCEEEYYFGMAKYDIVYEIFNITDKTVQSIELDYWVEVLINSSFVSDEGSFSDIFASEAITNFAIVYPIVDKSLDSNHYRMVNIRNDMLILNELEEAVFAQDYVPEPIGNNRFLVSDKSGATFLVNEKGTVIGDVSEAEYDAELKLFYQDGRYYDLDLKQVFDRRDITYEGVCEGLNYTLYRDGENNYYVLNGVTMKKVEFPENASFSGNYDDDYFRCDYYVEQESGTQYFVSYYNSLGEKIYTVETSASDYSSHSVFVRGDIFVVRLETYNESDYSVTTHYYIAK